MAGGDGNVAPEKGRLDPAKERGKKVEGGNMGPQGKKSARKGDSGGNTINWEPHLKPKRLGERKGGKVKKHSFSHTEKKGKREGLLA